jgi:hypothetical protein
MLDTLHYEDFAPHAQTKFRVQISEQAAMEFELISVEDKSPSPRQEQFVLTFRAPREAPVSQQIYPMTHERLGSGAMFLAPVGRDETGVIYEAVFNRKREAAQ